MRLTKLLIAAVILATIGVVSLETKDTIVAYAGGILTGKSQLQISAMIGDIIDNDAGLKDALLYTHSTNYYHYQTNQTFSHNLLSINQNITVNGYNGVWKPIKINPWSEVSVAMNATVTIPKNVYLQLYSTNYGSGNYVLPPCISIHGAFVIQNGGAMEISIQRVVNTGLLHVKSGGALILAANTFESQGLIILEEMLKSPQ